MKVVKKKTKKMTAMVMTKAVKMKKTLIVAVAKMIVM